MSGQYQPEITVGGQATNQVRRRQELDAAALQTLIKQPSWSVQTLRLSQSVTETGIYFVDATTGTFTVTLPVPSIANGVSQWFWFKVTDTAAVNIVIATPGGTTGGLTLNSGGTKQALMVASSATAWQNMLG